MRWIFDTSGWRSARLAPTFSFYLGPTLSQLLFDGLRDPTRGVALDRQGALDEVDDVMARALGKAS